MLIFWLPGTQIRTLYSQLYVDKIIQKSAIPYLTSRDIALNLQHYLSNRHCDVYTYISYENELIILILPINSNPSKDEVSAVLCLKDRFQLCMYLCVLFDIVHSLLQICSLTIPWKVPHAQFHWLLCIDLETLV